jgi:hypothetical protein
MIGFLRSTDLSGRVGCDREPPRCAGMPEAHSSGVASLLHRRNQGDHRKMGSGGQRRNSKTSPRLPSQIRGGENPIQRTALPGERAIPCFSCRKRCR